MHLLLIFDQFKYNAINISGMYTRQTYHILGMILSWTTTDFDGMLGLERKRKRGRGKEDGETEKASLCAWACQKKNSKLF